ncbi:hypothetical protein SAMN05421754_103423 [Nitrosomonas sp. Nm58]|nr:hypothetical protein SAMN05421754_103423 [Nitrosomonas sp. Nm58]
MPEIAVTTAEVTDRKDALLALGRCAAELRQVQCILTEGEIPRPTFRQGGRGAIRSQGANCQAERTSHFHCHVATLGSRTLSYLARKIPVTMEKLRAKTQHQFAVYTSGLPVLLLKRL